MPRINRAEANLRSVLTTFIDGVMQQGNLIKLRAHDAHKGPRHPYIKAVNAEAERLLRAFKAAVGEQVRELPGRAQKGARDAALRKITPDVAKKLRA